jgi:hypothetical protein
MGFWAWAFAPLWQLGLAFCTKHWAFEYGDMAIREIRPTMVWHSGLLAFCTNDGAFESGLLRYDDFCAWQLDLAFFTDVGFLHESSGF